MSKDNRCGWVGQDPLYIEYHDTEWGVPEYNSRALWENLTLEAFQAGLSWIAILKKRENFRKAFAGFDPNVIADWGADQVENLLQDSSIIRHRGKIEATIGNAKAWQNIENAQGFDHFLWRYVDHKPIINAWASLSEVPAQTPLSQQISRDLKAAGFKFCGPRLSMLSCRPLAWSMIIWWAVRPANCGAKSGKMGCLFYVSIAAVLRRCAKPADKPCKSAHLFVPSEH